MGANCCGPKESKGRDSNRGNSGGGGYLVKADKRKEATSGQAGNVKFVTMAMQGWRKSMEDAHIALTGLPGGVSVFGVFDGHGGREVALWVKENFEGVLVGLDSFKNA